MQCPACLLRPFQPGDLAQVGLHSGNGGEGVARIEAGGVGGRQRIGAAQLHPNADKVEALYQRRYLGEEQFR